MLNLLPHSIQNKQPSCEKPVKIMHIFGRMIPGGAELRTLDVMRRCSREGIHAEYVSLSGETGTLDDEIRKMGGEVHPLRLDRHFHKRFPDLLRERKTDIVHSHVYHSSGYIVRQAARAGVPRRIVHYRNDGNSGSKGLIRKAKTRILKGMVQRYATDILGVSESSLSSCWSENWKADPRCQVLYNGIDTSQIQKAERYQSVRQEFGIDETQTLFIHVGNFRKPKNHLRLIDIFDDCRKSGISAHLLLVGDRDANLEAIDIAAKTENEIHRRNLIEHVTLAGSRSDVFRLLQAADLMLFPSLTEGLPGVVLEAIACGTPVLASELPVIPEIQKFLPGIKARSLSSSNQNWVQCCREMLRQHETGDGKRYLQDEFCKSPFEVGQSSKCFTELWLQQKPSGIALSGKLAS